MPDRATVEIRKAKRGGRVYIDVLQNARGHHAVPPYVLRAVPGATVSTPLDWREVTAKLDPGAFTLKTVFTPARPPEGRPAWPGSSRRSAAAKPPEARGGESMAVHIGTSGWSYDHWEGVLYPRGASSLERLDAYARRFRTVEVNNTFYRWPKDEVFATWHDRLPDGFLVSVKASRGLTQFRKLNDPRAVARADGGGPGRLGEKRGVLLVPAPAPLRARPRPARPLPGRGARGPARGRRVPPPDAGTWRRRSRSSPGTGRPTAS